MEFGRRFADDFPPRSFSRATPCAFGRALHARSRLFLVYQRSILGNVSNRRAPDADYAASYFGGDDDDYDVVKHNADNGSYTVTATDGNLDALLQLWDFPIKWPPRRRKPRSTPSSCKCRGSSRRHAQFGVSGAVRCAESDRLHVVILYGGNLDAPISNFIRRIRDQQLVRHPQSQWRPGIPILRTRFRAHHARCEHQPQRAVSRRRMPTMPIHNGFISN